MHVVMQFFCSSCTGLARESNAPQFQPNVQGEVLNFSSLKPSERVDNECNSVWEQRELRSISNLEIEGLGLRGSGRLLGGESHRPGEVRHGVRPELALLLLGLHHPLDLLRLPREHLLVTLVKRELENMSEVLQFVLRDSTLTFTFLHPFNCITILL